MLFIAQNRLIQEKLFRMKKIFKAIYEDIKRSW